MKNMKCFDVTMESVFERIIYAMKKMTVAITLMNQKQTALIVVYVLDSFVPLTQIFI